MKTKSIPLAWFITPHGFGHASRSLAVMEQCLAQEQIDYHFHIFTTVPQWFIEGSIGATHHTYHPLLCDIGLIHQSSLQEDVPASLERLQTFYPISSELIDSVAEQVVAVGCSLVVSDISPMGLLVAETAGIPSVLIENFTWDWIYQGYPTYQQEFSALIEELQQRYALATYHIQSEPICVFDASATLHVSPISRQARSTLVQTRERLQIPTDKKVCLISMGGIAEKYPFLHQLPQYSDWFFVISGSVSKQIREENHLLLPVNAGEFHPDLVSMSDAVLGKVGYSTLAEVYASDVAFIHVKRSSFRESKILEDYIAKYMQGFPITAEEYWSGAGFSLLSEISSTNTTKTPANGAIQIATWIKDFLFSFTGESKSDDQI